MNEKDKQRIKHTRTRKEGRKEGRIKVNREGGQEGRKEEEEEGEEERLNLQIKTPAMLGCVTQCK